MKAGRNISKLAYKLYHLSKVKWENNKSIYEMAFDLAQQITNVYIDISTLSNNEIRKYYAKNYEALNNFVLTNKLTVAKVKKEKLETRTRNIKLKEESDEFLKSYQWRKLRMEAIKKYGNKCQCCGATPEDGIRINVDHIKPRKYHPELALDLNNLQILCNECNHGKGNWDNTDWRSNPI